MAATGDEAVRLSQLKGFADAISSGGGVQEYMPGDTIHFSSDIPTNTHNARWGFGQVTTKTYPGTRVKTSAQLFFPLAIPISDEVIECVLRLASGNNISIVGNASNMTMDSIDSVSAYKNGIMFTASATHDASAEDPFPLKTLVIGQGTFDVELM